MKGPRRRVLVIATLALILVGASGTAEAARTSASIVGSPALVVNGCSVATSGDVTGIKGPNDTMQLIWVYGNYGGGASAPFSLANKAPTFFFSGTMSAGIYDTIYLFLLNGRGETVDSRTWTGSWVC